MRTIQLLLCSLIAWSSWAQKSIPIGQWRIHLPYNSVRQMEETPEFIYVVAEVGLYSFHKKSGEIELYSKVNGYSDTEVTRIAYSDEYNTLVIGYKNTNLDLVKDGRIVNIQGILRKSIIGLKEINDIKTAGALAYVATSFGVVVIDMLAEEIKDSYLNIGPGGSNLDVWSVEVLADSLYLGTQDGIYGAELSSQVNLSDFSSWNLFRSSNGSRLLQQYNNKLYFVEDSTLYTYDGSFAQVSSTTDGYFSLKVDHDKLVVCRGDEINIYGFSGLERKIAEGYKYDAILDHQDNIWTGGFYTGMIKIDPFGQQSSLKPQGPFGVTTFEMQGYGTQMWVTSGGHSTIYAPTFTNTGYYVFEKGQWTNRRLDIPELAGMYDFTSIAINEQTGDIWLGSHGTGLCHLNKGTFVERFDANNTTALAFADQTDFTYCLGLALDSKQDLWVTNFETHEALKVRHKDGSWDSYGVGEQRLGEMVVDEFDQKWIALERESTKGIIVFKEDPDGITAPQVRVLTTSANGGNLPGNNVNALVVDKDGEIWVGTESGLGIFYNPFLVFEGGPNADAQQIIIDDGQDIGYLLGNEVINDIKIDGANRKWVATNNGAWLIKEDGTEVLKHFTEENSPLPSNTVNCMGIEPITGEVFLGTVGGIVSFRSDATEADAVNANPLVFPNPVHKGYNGPITITGLYENATVKIVDVAGRVVYEMIATGGTAVWDGRNFNGEKPHTGVYLIFTANEEDENALVSKLLIVR